MSCAPPSIEGFQGCAVAYCDVALSCAHWSDAFQHMEGLSYAGLPDGQHHRQELKAKVVDAEKCGFDLPKGAASNRLTQGGRLPQLFYTPLFGAAYLLAGDTTSLTSYGAWSATSMCMALPAACAAAGRDEMRAEVFTSVVAERIKRTVRRLVDVKVRRYLCGVRNRRQHGECLGLQSTPGEQEKVWVLPVVQARERR